MPLTTRFSTISSSSTTSVPGVSVKLDKTWRRTRWFIASSTERVCNTRALRCHFEHFLVGDSTQLLRLGNDARIGCVNTVDIGEDIAAFSVERGGERDRRGIGAAAAQRRHAAPRADPLEPGDDRDLAFVEAPFELGGVDGFDARLAG